MSESQEQLYDMNDPQEANYAETIEAQNNPGEDEQLPEESQDDNGSQPEDTPTAPETGAVEAVEESKTVTTDDIKRQARERRWKQVDTDEDAGDES